MKTFQAWLREDSREAENNHYALGELTRRAGMAHKGQELVGDAYRTGNDAKLQEIADWYHKNLVQELMSIVREYSRRSHEWLSLLDPVATRLTDLVRSYGNSDWNRYVQGLGHLGDALNRVVEQAKRILHHY